MQIRHEYHHSQDVHQDIYKYEMIRLREENTRLKREIQLLTKKNHNDDIEDKFRLRLKKIRSLSSFSRKKNTSKQKKKQTKKKKSSLLQPVPIQQIQTKQNQNITPHFKPKPNQQKPSYHGKERIKLPIHTVQNEYIYEVKTHAFKTPGNLSPKGSRKKFEPQHSHTMSNSPVSIKLMENSDKCIYTEGNVIHPKKLTKQMTKKRIIYENQSNCASQNNLLLKQIDQNSQQAQSKKRLLMNQVYLDE